jgi:hypothetical protein
MHGFEQLLHLSECLSRQLPVESGKLARKRPAWKVAFGYVERTLKSKRLAYKSPAWKVAFGYVE